MLIASTPQERIWFESELMEETYKRIFRRLGLDFRVVEADSGALVGVALKSL